MGQIGYVFNLILTFPIFNGLIVLDRLFGDFGLAILVLTLIIKLILFPLTLQQLKSTKATQALQPQMAEIRKKYANDQQAQAAALQTLYKEYGVNPLAGCLPLFIQLPVLYGLYFALRTGLNPSSKLSDLNALLYPFVPHFTHYPNVSFDWFTWLSFLNPILRLDWSWAFSLNNPDPSHILPVIAGLATFVQLRMSLARRPPSPDGKPVAVDPTQQSMKMMQYVMPFFTIFIAWNVPSGLALYWTISSIFQAVQQYFVTGWGGLAVGAPAGKQEISQSSSPVTSRLSQRSNATTSRKTSVVESTLVDGGEARVAGAGAGAGSGSGTSRTASTPKVNGNGSSSGGSQYTRRQRGSASARRRSGTQRAR